MNLLQITETVLIAAMLAGLLATARIAAGLRHQLHTDRLTGLANRDALARAFTRARRAGGPSIGLLLVDLNRFKQINDRYGHDTGNTVLRHTATRLAAATEAGELAVRLHGDEFAVLLTSLPTGSTGQQHAAHRAGQFAAALAQPINLGGVTVAVTASVGTATCAAGHAELSALLRAADQRMYAAKPHTHGTCPQHHGHGRAVVREVSPR